MTDFSEVVARRLLYFMSPQLDIYRHITPHLEGQKVVDVGFGLGFGALQLTRKAEQVIGIEIDKSALEFAKEAIPGVEWRYGDISRGIAYLGRDFDAALMIEVLEHVGDWQVALVNVRDVLKPGGKLYISARNANADLRKNDLHEREWRADQFRAALERYFVDVKLYDWKFEMEQDDSTRQTPLVAVARKEV